MQEVATHGLCPERCLCKWKGGKETVECVNSSLTRLPSLDASTQVLDLSQNSLIRITEDAFRSRSLLNLQKIYLRNCSIHIIIGRCFEGMTNLIDLDLSYNLLQAVPKEALSDCHFLMVLSLAGNPIRRIAGNQLANLKYLQSLDLSACQIFEVEPAAFADLRGLHWIKLDNNLLEQLSPATDFPNMTIKGVTLNGNRWRCDCHLVGLRDFLRNRSVAVELEPPICSSPDRISGQRISELSEAELACPPQLSPTSSFEETIQGKNISLVCTVNSVPASRVTWRYRGLLVNNGSTMVSDIDLRTYYYTNTLVSPGAVRSELVLSRTSVDDTGAFQCVAENRAGVAIGNFTVSVVTPVPPEPPKEMVEERFKQEHFVAIGVAGVVLSVLAIVTAMVFFIKCHRRRHASGGSGGTVTGSRLTCSTIAAGSDTSSKAGSVSHLYQCTTATGSNSFTSDKSLMAVHQTADSSSSSSCLLLKSGRTGEGGGGSLDLVLMEDDSDMGVGGGAHVYEHLMDDYGRQRGQHTDGGKNKESLSGTSSVHKFNHILLLDHNATYHQICPTMAAGCESVPGVDRPAGRKASLTTSYSLYEEAAGVDQVATAAQKSAKLVPSHWHFSTLPKKKLLLAAAANNSELLAASDRSSGGISEEPSLMVEAATTGDSQAVTPEIILPPPPQFKGVHFDPDVLLQAGVGFGLVLEGLPAFPAVPREERGGRNNNI